MLDLYCYSLPLWMKLLDSIRKHWKLVVRCFLNRVLRCLKSYIRLILHNCFLCCYVLSNLIDQVSVKFKHCSAKNNKNVVKTVNHSTNTSDSITEIIAQSSKCLNHLQQFLSNLLSQFNNSNNNHFNHHNHHKHNNYPNNYNYYNQQQQLIMNILKIVQNMSISNNYKLVHPKITIIKIRLWCFIRVVIGLSLEVRQ